MTFSICAPFRALMFLLGIVRNFGLTPETFSRWLTTWIAMLPIAYIAALIIVPAAKDLTDKLPWYARASCCGSLRGIVGRLRGIEIPPSNASCQTRVITHIMQATNHVWGGIIKFMRLIVV